VVLLVLHDFFYLTFSPFILTVIAAGVVYGFTGSLVIPAVILFVAPIIQAVLKIMKVERFENASVGAEVVSERIKTIKNKMPSSTAHDAAGLVTGTLGSSTIENFQSLDASGGEAPSGLPPVSIPAYVREKGRLLVVPESSKPPQVSVDKNPRPSPALITGEDGDSVHTALSPSATQLPVADQQAVTSSMASGPITMDD
jgi:hypothetical protein